MPLEVLSEDPSVRWTGWALAEMAAVQAAGSADLHIVRVAGERELSSSSATSAVRGYITVTGGRLRVHAVRHGLSDRRIQTTFDEEEVFPEGLLRAGNALSRWIRPDPGPFDTNSVDALRSFAEGREAEDAVSAAAAYQRAIGMDRNFGAPYVAWTQALLVKGDRDEAGRVIGMANERGTRISAPKRAELDLLQSALTNDRNLRRMALLTLSRANPADADIFRQLAAEDSAARRYDSAAGFYQRATQLDPLNASTWNLLGYVEAQRRNLDGARSALQEYARLEPNSANPLDSLGDVHYHLGRFPESERYYLEAYEKDPRFLNGADLYKAARARLMTGDLHGADELFRKYLETRKATRDPLVEYCQSHWLYLTGRKREGVSRMGQVAASATLPAVRSLAASQVGIWTLVSGGREQAAEWLRKAVKEPVSPVSARFLQLFRVLLLPPEDQSAGSDDQRRQLAAVSHLLSRQFADALPGLKSLAERSSPTGSDGARVLLAWALVETGEFREALPLLETYGTPPAGFEEPLTCLSFPRVFQLRAMVLEKAGRSPEAAESLEIFRKLSTQT